MALGLSQNAIYTLAKSFTELAIQNDLFFKFEDPAETAQQIAAFFDAVAASLDSTDVE